jgi:hypothetical protein
VTELEWYYAVSDAFHDLAKQKLELTHESISAYRLRLSRLDRAIFQAFHILHAERQPKPQPTQSPLTIDDLD